MKQILKTLNFMGFCFVLFLQHRYYHPKLVFILYQLVSCLYLMRQIAG